MRFRSRTLLPALLAVLALALNAVPALSQSATTGAASGVITAQDGAPLAGAAVEFTYGPTGFRSTVLTNERGAYRLQGLEPGGPYTVRVSMLGYRPVTRQNVMVGLGRTYNFSTSLEVSAVELEALVVEADAMASQFSPTTQGTETLIDQEQLEALPALDRRFENLARLTPQIVATDANNGLGLSVVGQNNRYNTIQIDGATVNDRFGLGATGTAGGQARGKPIGYDAVKEFQVLLSPYDVRQGNFTGALVNAVTKNGGNEFFGSAFAYFRNQDLANDPLGQTEFKNWQFGGSVGGPIVRDKAFFFGNLEFQRASTPASGPYIGAPSGVSGVIPDADDVAAFNSALEGYGLTPGSAGAVTNENPLTNITLRADWNLNDRNRLVFRYNYNRAQDDVFSRTTSTNTPGFRFQNNAYQFLNNTHNPSVQLFTNFANGSLNELRVSYNRIRDERDPFVAEPQVLVEGFFKSGGDQEYGLLTGSEQFSQGNRLDQDIFEITDNFTFAPMGDHTITIGTRNEIYSLSNLFAQSSYGVYTFDTLADFEDGGYGTASSYTVSGQLTGGPVLPAEFTSAQFGLYAQDLWQATDKLAITAGLRVDIPVFFDQPTFADQVIQDFGDQDVPSGQLLFNPRLGFNYDIGGEAAQQLRGGIGIFTGNPAYVWMSNAYANNGTGIGILNCGVNNPNGLAPAFSPDPGAQNLFCVDESGQPTVGIGDGEFLGEVDLIDKDTRFPQVLRANLAYDRRLPAGFLMTLEGIYNWGLNDYFIVNRNLGATGNGEPYSIDPNTGRVLYGTIDESGRSNPVYFRPSAYGSGSVGVFELRNTSENWSYNLTAGLQKLIGDDVRLAGAYTFSKAKDVQSFTSSRATSNWRYGRMNAGDQLAQTATTSSFDRPHKVTLSGTYKFPWENWPTEISLIYIGYSGTPYTYIAGGSSGRGDLNADGLNYNDPLYVPTGIDDPLMTFETAGDAQAYDALITSLDCMSEQRGQIMERNSCRNPWQSFLDLSVNQGLPMFGKNRFSVQLGIYNFLNFLNDDWGQIETAGGGVFDSQTVLRVVDAPGGDPVYTYSGPDVLEEGKDALYDNNGDPRNSWQLQLSLRYEFGGAF